MLTRRQTAFAVAAATAATLVGATAVIGAGRHLFGNQVCFADGVAFFASAKGRCISPKAVAALSSSPLIDGRGAPVTVELSHPNDPATAPATVADCDAYDAQKRAGWSAFTSRDMVREAYFIRACGTLKALKGAIRPKSTPFGNGALTKLDVEAALASDRFLFGPEETDLRPAPAVMPDGDRNWVARSEAQTVRLQEIAHADFDRDGLGDVLVYVDLRPPDGTAYVGALGLVKMVGPDGSPRLVWLQPDAEPSGR